MLNTKLYHLFLVLLGSLILFSSCKELQEYRQRINAITIDNIDLQRVRDGEYRGACDAILVQAEVLVKVQDHRITQIELVKHKHGRGAAAEVIPQRILEKQSLQVDAITGATSSSKVILEAIEQALRQGLVE